MSTTIPACFSWDMNDEREFVRNIGRHRHDSPRVLSMWPSRAELLRGYLASLEMRTDWGALDKGALRVFALEELLRETGVVA